MSLDPFYRACRAYVNLVDWATDTEMPADSDKLLQYAAAEHRAEQAVRNALRERDGQTDAA